MQKLSKSPKGTKRIFAYVMRRGKLIGVSAFNPENWSGRTDLNCRPRGPKPRALAKLSHAPLLFA